jgi:hypothetical protein
MGGTTGSYKILDVRQIRTVLLTLLMLFLAFEPFFMFRVSACQMRFRLFGEIRADRQEV